MTRQSQFLEPVDREDAHRLFQAQLDLNPVGVESVPLDQALGRIVATPIVAAVNVPGFDRSNFDGFAVNSNDVQGATETNPVRLKLRREKIPAGHAPDISVARGEAVSIATGGMLPRGTNAVCLVEDTELEGETEAPKLILSRSLYAGSGISFAGTDISKGETVLRVGARISSRETGVLAAIGLTEISVFKKPKVAVVSTGNEIVPPGKPIQPGQVYDSNARILADAVREVGGEPIEMGIAVDDLDELRKIVDQALQTADLVLLSGGTSKGEGDLCYQVARGFDSPGIVVHGVALKPGKPICLAVVDRKPFVILPGFPTSAIFTFHEFVVPVITRLAGIHQRNHLSTLSARLATKVNSEIGRTEFLLVSLLRDPRSHSLTAYPMGKGSGSVTTFSRADGFITIDRQTEIVEQGELVSVQKIGIDARVADLVIMGSHCQILDGILNDLQHQGIEVKYFPIGSNGGLRAVQRGDCDLAGVHLYDPQTATYNEPFLTDDVFLLKGYQRTQGFVFRKNDQRFDKLQREPVDQWIDVVADDDQMSMINRNQGSGTRILIDRLLKKGSRSLPVGYEIQVSSHHAVCAAVAQGQVDWGIAIEATARQEGLGFVPIEDEQFDFVVSKSRYNESLMRQFEQALDRVRSKQS